MNRWLVGLGTLLFCASWRAHAESRHEVPLTEGTTVESPERAVEKTPLSQSKGDTRPRFKPVAEESEREIQQLVAGTLIFWNLAASSTPPKGLVKESGLEPRRLRSFRKSIRKTDKLSGDEIKALRADFTDDLLATRVAARKRWIRFAERFQDAFPSFKESLPEILTVWGEARSLAGYTDLDLAAHQARVASILHVIRNRTRAACLRSKEKLCLTASHKIKWRVLTKRYQFSSFEPYDPNLAELAVGPATAKKLGALQDLAEIDQKALANIAAVIVKLNRHEIEIPSPLGDLNTRHYLTPELTPFDTKIEQDLKRELNLDPRRMVLRIPTKDPKFLATVPLWALQEALVSDPPIKILDQDAKHFHQYSIPPTEFIFFHGVL